MKLLYSNKMDAVFIVIMLSWSLNSAESLQVNKPNIIILLADDLGIGDLGCYGNTTIKTPNIDRLASEGVILQHHLAVAGLCTPNRAALLTGRYPARYGLVGEEGTPPVIVHVASRVGLPTSETTIAEALFLSGYATAAVGKWHLGSHCELLGRNCLGPLKHGFSHYFGIMFTLCSDFGSNAPFWYFDITDTFYQALAATEFLTLLTIAFCWKKKYYRFGVILLSTGSLLLSTVWFVRTHYRFHTEQWWQVSPWMNRNLNGVMIRNGVVVHQKVPFDHLFQELVTESVEFIENSTSEGKPFFLYHAFTHVHTPMFTATENAGKSCCGRYGDNVEEMDKGVGMILDALRRKDIQRDTIVYFLSDHGGHLEAIDDLDGQRTGGYNKLFKGGKGMGAPEGAIRIPGIFWWPGVLSSGSSVESPTSLLDTLPTILQLLGLPPLNEIVPTAKELDGISFASKLMNSSKEENVQKRVLIHHCRQNIQALRLVTESKIYKMYLFLHRWELNSTQCGWGEEVLCSCYGDGIIDVSDSPILYELYSDPYEDYPINTDSIVYEAVVAELRQYLRDWRGRITYPHSQFFSKPDTILLPWLQPIKFQL